jgi:hypothetical protein
VRLPIAELTTRQQIDAVAADHPDDVVAVRTSGGYEMVRAEDLTR